MKFSNSVKIYEKAVKYIPMGTSTFSRNPNLFVIGAAPLYVSRAKGCRLFDVDGNEYIDYAMALSIIILGYADPEVNAAAQAGINEGLIYTLSCPEESQLAQKITELIPCAEMVRFVKSGSDSCEGAIRLARHFTRKTKIVTVGGYHGFHDWFLASTPRNKGIPHQMSEWVLPHDYNDLSAIENTIKKSAHEIAALIMEPVINYEPQPGFLDRIRELTAENNICLVFDEMKTGFRLDLGGAQKYFNVTPDLAVFGKGLANGFPLSALVGKKYLMERLEDENCFLSASYATEKASLCAALKTLEIMESQPVLEHVWETGRILREGVEQAIAAHRLKDTLEVVGLPPMFHLIISESETVSANAVRSFLQQEAVKKGVLFVGYHHTSWAHTMEDIEYTLNVYDDLFYRLKLALQQNNLENQLEGKCISAFNVRQLTKTTQ